MYLIKVGDLNYVNWGNIISMLFFLSSQIILLSIDLVATIQFQRTNPSSNLALPFVTSQSTQINHHSNQLSL